MIVTRKTCSGAIDVLFPICNPCVETTAWVGLTEPAICLLSMRENSAFWSAWCAAIAPLTVSPPFQFLPNFIFYSNPQLLCHLIPNMFVPRHNEDEIERYFSYLENKKNEGA